MAPVSTADRQRQLRLEESGQHLYANRVRVYPKAVQGKARRVKWAILVSCLTIYYVLPWLRWDRGPGRPDQALLLDLAHERFYFFGFVFWPQDIHYLTGLLIMAAVALFLVTSLFGRLWCGYACPQTVWTDLFMWIERRIEGDRNARMKRDAGPVNADFIWRKVLKHTLWLAAAFWTGGAWIMYYADAPTVTVQFWTGTAAMSVYVFTALFTATTYLLAGWAREQVCTYMCPWPRFQSAMLDEQSVTVTYQSWRGEPRGKAQKGVAGDKHGDCIDCGNCVTVCPTGIDIRDGMQLECINCGLCVDACNHVMARTGRDPGLITWDTLAHQAAKAAGAHQAAKSAGRHAPTRWLRPRTMIYAVAMLTVTLIMLAAMATRPLVEMSVQHDRAPLFVRLADGSYRNFYTVRIVNKTQGTARFLLTSTGLAGVQMALAEPAGQSVDPLILTVPIDSVGIFRVVLSGRPERMGDGSLPVVFSLRDAASGESATYQAAFMGPPDRAAGR